MNGWSLQKLFSLPFIFYFRYFFLWWQSFYGKKNFFNITQTIPEFFTSHKYFFIHWENFSFESARDNACGKKIYREHDAKKIAHIGNYYLMDDNGSTRESTSYIKKIIVVDAVKKDFVHFVYLSMNSRGFNLFISHDECVYMLLMHVIVRWFYFELAGKQ